ncbi:hypothetical protein KGQ55_01800 [Patescibacteria group bacterium]|nr:hypothetical protein [Patescibacteria group bacterium]
MLNVTTGRPEGRTKHIAASREARVQELELRARAIPPSSFEFEYLLIHAASGLSPIEIGTRLGVSMVTVRDALTSACQKLGLKYNFSLSPENRALVLEVLGRIPEADAIAKDLVARFAPQERRIREAYVPTKPGPEQVPVPVNAALKHALAERVTFPPAQEPEPDGDDRSVRVISSRLSLLSPHPRRLAAFVALGVHDNVRLAKLTGYKSANAVSATKNAIWKKLGVHDLPMAERIEAMHLAFATYFKAELMEAHDALTA